jgi:hypothetical protein
MRTPAKCHPARPGHAFGLCHTCYVRNRRNRWATCHPDRFRSRGDPTLCHPCYLEQVTIPKTKARAWERGIAKRFGISAETYRAILLAQGGRCAICRGQSVRGPLAVDHDHATGQIRGLLCTLCNRGLGAFRDDPAFLQAAASYLAAAKANVA